MKFKVNQRGFAYSRFYDSGGQQCSIQKASSVIDKIWIGVNDPKVIVFPKEGQGGPGVEMVVPSEWMICSRMELTPKIVKRLLPYLKRFAKTGELK